MRNPSRWLSGRQRRAIWIRVAAVFMAVGAGSAVASAEEPPDHQRFRVALFTPTTEGNTYWPEVHRVMRAAADALNIGLDIHEAPVRDRLALPDASARILTTAPVPDAVIAVAVQGLARPILDAAENAGIPIMVNGPLPPSTMAELGGGPRRSYRQWIGYFHEDEEQKGYLLARALLAAARERDGTEPGRTVRVVGVGGDPSWHGSALRESGLRRAVAEDPGAQLLQTAPTWWTQEEGTAITTRLLQRYPDVSVVWTASDQLALGAAEATREFGLEPGHTVVTGGLDLSAAGLEAVLRGELAASVASPPLVWAQILALVYDYLSGSDFIDLVGSEIKIPPVIADRHSVHAIIEQRRSFERFDYRSLSRHLTGDASAYDQLKGPER